jgi:hypothetical protein
MQQPWVHAVLASYWRAAGGKRTRSTPDISRDQLPVDKIRRFGAVLYAKLAQDTLHMLLKGLLGEVQSLGNSVVTVSLAD